MLINVNQTHMINKSLILDRVKDYFHLKGNSQLAEFLGVTRQTISNWYSRNSIDYDIIITKCTAIDNGIDLKWLLTSEVSNHLDKTSIKGDYIKDDEDEEINRSVKFLTDEYDRFKDFSESLIDEQGYLDKALKTADLCDKIREINSYADESSVIYRLRSLYTQLKKGEITEVEIKQELVSLISYDKRFYELVAPYDRELNALNAILELNDHLE